MYTGPVPDMEQKKGREFSADAAPTLSLWLLHLLVEIAEWSPPPFLELEPAVVRLICCFGQVLQRLRTLFWPISCFFSVWVVNFDCSSAQTVREGAAPGCAAIATKPANPLAG